MTGTVRHLDQQHAVASDGGYSGRYVSPGGSYVGRRRGSSSTAAPGRTPSGSTYQQGDTVRWRVINFTGRPHPMHLHGFYFRVDARGDRPGGGLRAGGAADGRDGGPAAAETMRITWVPTEPGNWVFHCHFMRHMSWLQTAPLTGSSPRTRRMAATSPKARTLMGGLVLGITVRPGTGLGAGERRAAPPAAPAHRHAPGVFGDEPGYGFVLQEGRRRPRRTPCASPAAPSC
jgi:manganese oxidase